MCLKDLSISRRRQIREHIVIAHCSMEMKAELAKHFDGKKSNCKTCGEIVVTGSSKNKSHQQRNHIFSCHANDFTSKINQLTKSEFIAKTQTNEKNKTIQKCEKKEDSSKEKDDTVQITDRKKLYEEINRQTNLLIRKSENMWQCCKCEYKTRERTTILRHAETHLEGFTHCCNVCDKTFKTRKSFEEHMRNHRYGPVECSVCKKSYANKRGLKSHFTLCHGKQAKDEMEFSTLIKPQNKFVTMSESVVGDIFDSIQEEESEIIDFSEDPDQNLEEVTNFKSDLDLD